MAWLGLAFLNVAGLQDVVGPHSGTGKDVGKTIFLHVALCQFVVLVSAFRIVGLFLIVVVVLLRFASVGWPE